MAYSSTSGMQCCHFRRRYPSFWVFCLRDGQACPFCGWIVVQLPGLLYQKTDSKVMLWQLLCAQKPWKREKAKELLLLGQLPLGPSCILGPAFSDDGVRGLVGNHCTLRQELVRAPWSSTSLMYVFKAVWVWYGLQGQGNWLPELESLLSLGVTSGEGTKWERKVWHPGSHFKAQESMLSLPALKPWTVTGNLFSFLPSTSQPILQWRRKEGVQNINSLGLWPQS